MTQTLVSPINESQQNQYRTEGYTTVPGFFDAAEVRLMQKEIDRLVAEGLLRNVATLGDGKTQSTTKANLQICPLSPVSEVFRALPFSEKVRSAVGRLIGGDFHLQLDQIFLKPARHGAGTNWHQDNAYFQCADPFQGVGMWVAVHDATVANGTMHVVPRSHESALKHERDTGSDHHITCRIEENATIVPIELAAGGVLFFNYGVAHCTKANTTDQARAGLAEHFVTATHLSQTRAGGRIRPKLAGAGFDGGLEAYGVDLRGAWEAMREAA